MAQEVAFALAQSFLTSRWGWGAWWGQQKLLLWGCGTAIRRWALYPV